MGAPEMGEKLLAARLIGVHLDLALAIILTCAVIITSGDDMLTLNGEPELEFVAAASFDAAPAPAPATAPKVIKPLISKSAKVRAELEKAHLKASEEKRVKVTIANSKLKYTKEHAHKQISRAKKEKLRIQTKSTEKGVKYVKRN